MSIVIENLYGLICIPFVILSLWWSIKKQRGTVLKKGIIASRIVLCSLLIGALCGISCKIVGKNVATVFLLDVSDSMRDFREEGVTFIQDALENMPKNHTASVIVFGSDSQVDKFLDESKNYSKISATPTSSATNIEQALQSALTYLPEEANKEIILLSDGQENEGDMLKATELIKNANVDFKVYQVGHQKQSEVYVDDVTVPEKIYKDESFSVVTKVVSNVKTKATLTLLAGNEKKSEQQVELEVGENSFVFKDVQSLGGFKSYKAMITPEEDHEISNNEYICFTTVEDAPQVLLIEGEKGEGIGIENVLKQMGGNYKVVKPQRAPDTLERMIAYKAIVLVNTYEGDLPEGFLSSIESYVKGYGGGLIVTGGDNAYALGGYEHTVLEDILPVDMHKKGQMAMPGVSLCLVIDHSGSMSESMGGTNKLGLSVQAAAAVVDYLEEKDEISVFSFDDSYAEVVQRQNVTDKEAIKELIYGIEEGGGTSIYPALEAAYQTQLQSKADIKHIILLTDGQDSFATGQYSSLVNAIQENNITLSTVAVGDGANNRLLEHLAEIGGGRNYIADQMTSLPRIFAREFFLSSGEYLVNETFTPQVTSSHEVLQDVVEDGAFQLNGYIGTSMKPLATQVLTSHQAEPVLALWQYGLGKTVAWTSDVNGEWSGPLFQSSKGMQLFKNILSWSMTTYEGEGEVLVDEEGTGVRITFKTNEVDYSKGVTASYQGEDGNAHKVELTEVSPGVYESYVPLEEKGFYAFSVTEALGSEISANYITAFAKQYSKEYKFIEDEGKLMTLMENVEGSLITLPSEAFNVTSQRSYKTIELTNILLMIAFIWFLVDIITRRFKLSFAEIKNLASKFISKKNGTTQIVDYKKTKENKHLNEKHNVETKVKPKKDKKPKKVKAQKGEKQEAKGLDTTALLKRKQDRDLNH